MNKKIMAAIGIALGADCAFAQSNVTIYGIADIAFVSERGGIGGNVNKITNGGVSASRIGFRGSEELGNGVSAFFTLENGYRIDTGEVDAAGTMFNRQSFVGLKTRAGTLTIGRQYTPWHQTLGQVADPFVTGYAGTSKNLFPDSGTNVRTSNTVQYSAPPMKGLVADLAYSFGEQAGSSKTGRQMGASIGYAAGKLAVRYAYNNKNTDVLAAPGVTPVSRGSSSNHLVAANYDVTVVRLYAAYGKDKGFNSAPIQNPNNPYGGVVRPTPSTDSKVVLLGLSAPVPGGTVIASVMRKDDETRFNQDARGWGIAYAYALSKRSSMYTSYGAVLNENGAGYTVGNNGETGSGDRAFNVGVRHVF
jgi:predicted porin